MGALSDIKAAMRQLPKLKRGHSRVVLVGISAERSLACDGIKTLDANAERMMGMALMPTLEFNGWAIRDCDTKGRWHERAG